MSGYSVSTDELATHATTMRGIVSQVHTAGQAAQQEGVMGGGNPYGVLFTPMIVPPLEAVCLAAQGMIAGLGELGEKMTDSLDKNVDLYTLVESRIAGLLAKAVR